MRRVVWPRLRGLKRIVSPGFGLQDLKRILGLSAVAYCAVLGGCGGQYRPVVTPVSPTGPAPQPQSFLLVTTNTGADAPGLANVFDGSGDTLLTQASVGNGPVAATLNVTGSPAVTANTDGTVSSYDPSTTLRSNLVQTSTLIGTQTAGAQTQAAQPYNMISTAQDLFIALPQAQSPVAAVLQNNTSGVYQLVQELPLAASPVNFAGNSNSQRIYAISQDNGSNSVAFGACENPSSVSTPGQVAAIETSTLSISRTLPVGVCPVYGIGSTDNLRTYILNRGSGTVTVINTQFNELDSTPNRQNLNPATGTLTLPPPAGSTGSSFKAGPVFADYYQPTQQLVTANYDSNTISIINVSLDIYGNDGPLFGQTVTIPVGNGPAALTILRDGSRVYVANQKDSTVTVVNLTTFQVEATIPVQGHPFSIASIYSTPFGQVFVIPSDQPYMTVIRTDTDQVNAAVQLDGTGIDVRSTTQAAGVTSSAGGADSANNVSRASGSGAPCGFGLPYYLKTGPCAP